MATQVRTIRVINKVDGANEIRKLSRQYGQLNKGVKSSSDSLRLFKRAFQFSVAGFGLRELIRAADQFQLLRDRIKVFTGDAKSARDAFNLLAEAARFTRTSIGSLATSFNRIALATQELGLNTEQIIALTTALQQTFRLSGSTIAEASAATIQFSQSLSSGEVRGQELRSVIEANATFANILSEQLGITRGQLLKFGETGKITSTVALKALQESFKGLNKDAQKLGQTFEQTITIALDRFKIKIDELNESFNVSGKFADAIVFITENVEKLGTALLVLVGSKAILTLAGQITLLSRATSAGVFVNLLSKSNLLIGALTAAGFAVSVFVDKLKNPGIEELNRKLSLNQKQLQETAKRINIYKDTIKDARSEKLLGAELDKLNVKFKRLQREGAALRTQLRKASQTTEDFGKRAEKSLDGLDLGDSNLSANLSILNFKIRENIISFREYDQALANIQLQELNKKFEEGKIDIDAYNKSLIGLSQNLMNINPISLGAVSGLRKVADSASNVASQIEQGFVKAFKSLEDAIFEFTKKGVFDFQKFSQAIIDEITRIVIRAQIIAPIAQGIGQLLFGGGGAGAIPSGGGGGIGQSVSAGAFANGGVFNGGKVTAFANGGIVGGPTVFPFANGVGLMGEAGPEAIMPLTRRNGKLGVEGSGTVVNINNMVGGEVETSERQGPSGERILDVTIKRKIQESLSDGSLDKDFSENFGLRRRGS